MFQTNETPHANSIPIRCQVDAFCPCHDPAVPAFFMVLQFTLSCWVGPMSSVCADAIIACLGRFVLTGIHVNARIQGLTAEYSTVIGFNVVTDRCYFCQQFCCLCKC